MGKRRSTLIVRQKYAQKIKKVHVRQNEYQMTRNKVKNTRRKWPDNFESKISTFLKPVDCSDFGFSDVYDRKRRSEIEEFPLIAQLSTSIQITVNETVTQDSEQPNFDDILQ